MVSGNNKTGSDKFLFAREKSSPYRLSGNGRQWTILIVDDDVQVHDATTFALMDIMILGRTLHFLHAYSAREAKNILETTPDIAVVFLDVVMESENAGLDLVRVIREELDLHDLRIILRTGQPGSAPELEAIRDFDINDYRTKGELTRTRLVTSLTTAIRSYEQIHTINASRQGLEKIVRASSELFDRHALESMAEGVLTQMAGLLHLSPNGLVCAQRGYPLDGSDPDRLYIVGAVGRYANAINKPLDMLGDSRIETAIRKAMMLQQSIFLDEYSVLYLNSGNAEEAVFMDSTSQLQPMDVQLLEVFTSNISVGFANVYLFNRLNYLAYHDTLTGLPNRTYLHEQARQILEQSDTEQQGIALMLLDLDRFKEINDTLGHHVGDSLLSLVATRLKEVCTELSVTISRLGGDEFALLLQQSQDCNTVSAVANRIRNSLTFPFEIQGMSLEIGASIGVACYPVHGKDSHELLRSADVAMYQAKSRNIGVMVYDPEFDTHTPERLAIMTDLGQAIRGEQLLMHYQPKLDLKHNRVVGLEALVRWRHPRIGLLYPDKFIHLAEMSDLINPLTYLVIDMVLQDMQKLQMLGHRFPISVNLSARNLMDTRCLPELRRLVESSGMHYQSLELELTETALMQDPDSAARLLDQIAALGIKLSIDDYGTGYSSLAYLRRLPLSALKIDRSFVGGMLHSAQDAVIVRSTISLAHNLGLRVTAEGVEEVATMNMLKEMSCDEVQGYALCRPLALEDLLHWLTTL